MCIPSGEWVTILEVRRYLKNRSFKSLRFYVTLLLMLVGIIPCIVTKVMVLESYERRAVNVRTAEIQNQCTILCNQLTGSGYRENGISRVIQSELIQLSNVYNGRIMVVDDEFTILLDTFNLETGKTMISEDIMTGIQGEQVKRYDGDSHLLEVVSPIHSDDETGVIGAMLISVSTDTIDATKVLLRQRANMVLGCMILLVIVMTMIIGDRMVRPFARITQSIGDLTDGYDADYLHVYTYQETRLISDAFNKMLGRLKRLDESRQEFVSNVSHELKTPLTAMKVLADSLTSQDNVPVELYREFMTDLSQEIERENKIINDLLALVKMDKSAAVMNVQMENLNELIEQCLKRLQPIADAAGVEVVYESARPVNAEVDVTKLSLALTNLVENGIKYNQPGGWVHISLNADHQFFYIEIADSGIGIPEEDQEQIFERFYRVDKSHSREIGGTGLGLAIARNVIVLHRGAVKVFSQVGEGTTFTVKIPINYAG